MSACEISMLCKVVPQFIVVRWYLSECNYWYE